MSKKIRLNDVFPNWKTSGIFSALQAQPVPWAAEDIVLPLNLEYHGNVSGRKLISPLVKSMLVDDALSETDPAILAQVIYTMFGRNWDKLWATMEAEYNPIENYSMVEQMTNDTTVDQYGKTTTRTDNLQHAKTGTETNTPNTTETTTPNLTTNESNQVYGFNSNTGVNADESVTAATGTNTVQRTGTDTIQYNTQDAETGTQQHADSGSDTHTRNYRLTRSGNIGVTTSQQMLESERALWVWNFFRDVVFPDVDKVLTIGIY